MRKINSPTPSPIFCSFQATFSFHPNPLILFFLEHPLRISFIFAMSFPLSVNPHLPSLPFSPPSSSPNTPHPRPKTPTWRFQESAALSFPSASPSHRYPGLPGQKTSLSPWVDKAKQTHRNTHRNATALEINTCGIRILPFSLLSPSVLSFCWVSPFFCLLFDFIAFNFILHCLTPARDRLVETVWKRKSNEVGWVLVGQTIFEASTGNGLLVVKYGGSNQFNFLINPPR